MTIHLLYGLVFSEMAVILTLLFKTPLRKLVLMSLDLSKRGRGPVVVKTIAVTLLVVFGSSLYNMVKIRRRIPDLAAMNPTDQVLMAWGILETSLMGFILFLALMIDRLHYYIRELRLLRKAMEATKKQSRGADDGRSGSAGQFMKLKEEAASLRTKLSSLQSEYEKKDKEEMTVAGESEVLKKQSEGLLMEYDRLLADNQNLRSQLQSIDQLASSEEKKNM